MLSWYADKKQWVIAVMRSGPEAEIPLAQETIVRYSIINYTK